MDKIVKGEEKFETVKIVKVEKKSVQKRKSENEKSIKNKVMKK